MVPVFAGTTASFGSADLFAAEAAKKIT